MTSTDELWREVKKKLTNIDLKFGLGEGGLAKGDVHKIKENPEDENTEKQGKY